MTVGIGLNNGPYFCLRHSGARDGETSTRLWLKALAASDDGKGLKPDAAQRELVLRVLGDAGLTRTHMDVLANEAADIVQVLTAEESPERAALMARYEAALVKLQTDATLSRADRLSALVARVRLGRLGQGKDVVQPKLPEALLHEAIGHGLEAKLACIPPQFEVLNLQPNSLRIRTPCWGWF